MDVFTGKRGGWMVLPILYLKMAHLGVIFLIFREFITSTLHPGSTGSFGAFSRFKNFHPSNFLWWVYKNHLVDIAYHSFLLSLFTKSHNFLSWSQPVQETGSYSTKNIFLSFTMCDNSFPNQSQLEIRPYICNNCRKSFKEEKTSKHTNSFTRGKHTIVNSVKSHSHKREIWCHTIELTLEKSHSLAKYVKRLLHNLVIWKHTRAIMRGRNRLFA